MYKRIMVALAQSGMNQPVLAVAIDPAKATRASLALCHAADAAIYAQREVAMPLPSRVGKTETRLRLDAQSFLERQAEATRAAGVEVVPRRQIRTAVGGGHVACDGQRLQADLLVLGLHGLLGIERIFFGSTAERLVRKADISLLLARGEGETS